MPPRNNTFDASVEDIKDQVKEKPYKQEYIPKHVYICIYGHLAALYGLYLAFTVAKWQTLIFAYFLYLGAILGITAGNHRLFCHHSFKAKTPLKVILAAFACLSFQYSSIIWVRDHRSHHKFSETDADPYNSSRGFFFSHIGWLLMNKHPEVKRRGKVMDLSDVYSDKILRFQHEHFEILGGLICFILPTVIPLLWGESLSTAWHITLLRYVISLHCIWLVNSYAHIYGNRPYDKNYAPTQSVAASILTLGEGFHNYHHVFPFDYRAAELGNNKLNMTTLFINFFGWLGWAYDFKTASEEMVKQRMKRTGDGSNIWGY